MNLPEPTRTRSKRAETVAQMAKNKTKKRQAEVLSAIIEMQRAGEKVTFYSVQKRTGAARSFLYGNDAIRSAIEEARDGAGSLIPAEDHVSTIAALKERIAELEKENQALREALGREDVFL